MIWTEEQKATMQRMRDKEGMSNAQIGSWFNTSGDNVRKVLARLQKRSATPETAEAEAAPDSLRRLHDKFDAKATGYMRNASPKRLDDLQRLHDEFDAKVPERAASRPKWAGRPPLRIMPKDFQR